MRKPHKQKQCKTCGEMYTPVSNNSLYCSERCARKARIPDIQYIQERVKGITKYRWKLVQKYDCRCAVCGYTRYRNFRAFNFDESDIDHIGLAVHHILPVSEGGKDEEKNLILLCPNCHKEAHDGLLSKETLYSLQENTDEKRRDVLVLTGIDGSREVVWDALFGEIKYQDSISMISNHFNIDNSIIDDVFLSYFLFFSSLKKLSEVCDKKKHYMISDVLKTLAVNCHNRGLLKDAVKITVDKS